MMRRMIGLIFFLVIKKFHGQRNLVFFNAFSNVLFNVAGYCNRYYFGEKWLDCKTDEVITAKDAKCQFPADDSLSTTAQAKDYYCGP